MTHTYFYTSTRLPKPRLYPRQKESMYTVTCHIHRRLSLSFVQSRLVSKWPIVVRPLTTGASMGGSTIPCTWRPTSPKEVISTSVPTTEKQPSRKSQSYSTAQPLTVLSWKYALCGEMGGVQPSSSFDPTWRKRTSWQSRWTKSLSIGACVATLETNTNHPDNGQQTSTLRPSREEQLIMKK